MELDKDYNLIVGLRIREVREVLNMTREQFSEKCDISSSFLSAVESGKKAVTSKTLYKICSSVNISADYFIRGKNKNFETDMVIEMIDSMDSKSKEHAVQILRDYIEAVNDLKKRRNDSPPDRHLGMLSSEKPVIR